MERSEGDRARRESRSCFQKKDPSARMSLRLNGERGIRTPDTGLTPYNGLANRRLQPLGHLSGSADDHFIALRWADKRLFGNSTDAGRREEFQGFFDDIEGRTGAAEFAGVVFEMGKPSE